MLAMTACSGDDDASPATACASSAHPAADGDRLEGPAADLSEELTGGEGVFIGSADPTNIGEGHVQREYVAEGTASAYRTDAELTADGRWTFEPDAERALPDTGARAGAREAADDFSGTVVVEWLNVSGGVDADPEFVTLAEEIRDRATCGSVSPRRRSASRAARSRCAVPATPEQAAVIGKGLKVIDPARYRIAATPRRPFGFFVHSRRAPGFAS